MGRYEVTSGRLTGHRRGDVVELDPDAVNIPALLAAGHIKPAQPEPARGQRGNARTR